jgi:hypothetical protein
MPEPDQSAWVSSQLAKLPAHEDTDADAALEALPEPEAPPGAEGEPPGIGGGA